jgi:hypothetical protein
MTPLPRITEDKIAPAEREDVDWLGVYRSLLRIVAHLQEAEYSVEQSSDINRQVAEVALDDLAHPASD